MIYLLDTNTCIGYLTRRTPIVDKVASLSPQDITLCDIVKAELYYGAYKGTRLESNLVLFREFFNLFISLPFDSSAAEV
jgi:tRNA(fMet)-specific endonuclease VapC